MKHQHADLIHAWADGAQIQFRLWGGMEWIDTDIPQWEVKYEYRIKPEEKQPVVRWQWASKINGFWRTDSTFLTDAESVQHLNYSHVVKKLEYTRQEFPE
jgi:hypothetical protein